MQKKIFLLLILFYASIYSYDGVTNPRVSIITSLYKGDKFIRSFLEDISRQTIFPSCELIIINANSPENEEPIVLEYVQKYPNIKYFRLEKDPGLYGVWNIAIKKARAEYITNANIDDRLHPRCYEEHAWALDCNPDVGVVYSGSYSTTIPNETFNEVKSHWEKISFTQQSYTKEQMLYGLSKKPHSVSFPHNHPMWRRSLHQNYGLFDTRFKAAGDLEMWLRLRLIGDVKFKKVDGYYGLYYWNPEGLSTNVYPKRDETCLKEHAKIDEFYTKIYEERFKTIEFLP